MKKTIFYTIATLSTLMFMLTACGEKVSNNLGGATRGTNAYDYNYDYSATKAEGEKVLNDLGFNRGRGTGYWDYYGITNGSANDTLRNDLTGTYMTPNTNTDITYPQTQQSHIGTPSLDSASVTN